MYKQQFSTRVISRRRDRAPVGQAKGGDGCGEVGPEVRQIGPAQVRTGFGRVQRNTEEEHFTVQLVRFSIRLRATQRSK